MNYARLIVIPVTSIPGFYRYDQAMEEIKGLICRRIIPILSFLALLAMQPAVAQEYADEPASTCTESCFKDSAQKIVSHLFSYPKKFGLVAIEHLASQAGPALSFGPPAATYPAGPSQWEMDKIAFQDNSTLVGRLRGIEDLSLLTFWENRSAKLYLGISKDGIAGINIRQKRHKPAPSQGSRHKHSKLDARPVIHDPYALLSAN